MKPRAHDNEVGWQRRSRSLLSGRWSSAGFITVQLLLQLGAGDVQPFGFDFDGTKTFHIALDYQTPHDYAAEAHPLRAQLAAGVLTIHIPKHMMDEGQT